MMAQGERELHQRRGKVIQTIDTSRLLAGLPTAPRCDRSARSPRETQASSSSTDRRQNLSGTIHWRPSLLMNAYYE